MVRLSGSLRTAVTVMRRVSSACAAMQVGHAVDPAAPQRLVLGRAGARARRSRSMLVRTTLRRPMRCLGDQAGPLEHRDVLLHGREAHRVVRRPARRCPRRPSMARRTMSRRVASARAAKTRSSVGGRSALIQPYGCMTCDVNPGGRWRTASFAWRATMQIPLEAPCASCPLPVLPSSYSPRVRSSR